MKKNNLANKFVEEELPGLLKDHEHVHAANCGHKSYVHGNHIDYEHDGHYHYFLDGKAYECEGPFSKKPAAVIPISGKKKKK